MWPILTDQGKTLDEVITGPWPSSLCVCGCRGSWAKGLPVGDHCCQGLLRSRCSFAIQHHCQRPRSFALLDNRTLGVVAESLPQFNGAQLAIDTTMVSTLRHTSGTAIISVRKFLTHPELSGIGVIGVGHESEWQIVPAATTSPEKQHLHRQKV